MAHAKIAQPQQTEKSDQQTVKQDSLTLGQHLSAVLNSPDLPGDLHTRIWDCLGDIPTGDLMDEPDFLDKLLKVGQAKAQKPTPAAEDQPEAEEESSKAVEPTLEVTMDQFRRLQKVWYAFGELADMIDAPEDDGGGLECLKIVNDQALGGIIGELQAQVDKAKGGAA